MPMLMLRSASRTEGCSRPYLQFSSLSWITLLNAGGLVTCFGQQNIHRSDACYSKAEAFENLWPILQAIFSWGNDHRSRHSDIVGRKVEQGDELHSLKLYLLSTNHVQTTVRNWEYADVQAKPLFWWTFWSIGKISTVNLGKSVMNFG